MEKQIGLSSTELEQIFGQIKSKGDTRLSDKIYKAYEPMKNACMKQYNLKNDQVNDIYDDVFCYVYNNALNGVIVASNFGTYFVKIMNKECLKKTQEKNFNSDLLSMSYAKNQPSREQEKEAEQQFATASLMYVTQVLNTLAKNPEMAAEHGLTEEKIKLVKHYFGLNKEGKRHNAVQLAQKYGISESRARALLASGLKAIRDMKEFETIKSHLNV